VEEERKKISGSFKNTPLRKQSVLDPTEKLIYAVTAALREDLW
jgi:hypothetical protein